ncbi:MAG TPA: glycosyltransferase family 4 protein, partial [Rhodopila sp.]|nr:glycosyltransferase family 4 protein [Rhodopila sp.]
VQMDADSVQLHAPALVGSAAWPAPLIVTVHSCVGTWWRAVHGGSLPSDLAWRAAAAADGLAAADAVIAPSDSFAADLRACYGLGRCIHVIPNGRQPCPGRGTRRPIALTAGRLWDEGKGMSTLDAAARLIPHPVYAAGPHVAPHGAVARFPYLNLLGSLDEATLANWYAKAAVFTSVSRYEPFGLAVLEAAQAGCALVLSDIATFRELWDGAAVFVPVDDPVALAGALRRVLCDGDEADRLGRLAQARAARFDPRRMVASTWNVHAAVLAREAI